MGSSNNKHPGDPVPIHDFKKFPASTHVPLMEDRIKKAEEEKGRVALVSRGQLGQLRLASMANEYLLKKLIATQEELDGANGQAQSAAEVDGTHLVTLEPGDSNIPKDPSYFSFKHHAAGFNYEVGICLFQNRCIWLSGPHKAGTYNDAKTFRECGLKDKLQEAGKKAIGVATEGFRIK